MVARTKRLPRIGWREWLVLPELSSRPMKAKVDTGARTSALHAFDLEILEIDGEPVASFTLHPVQRSSAGAVRVESPVVGFRSVRSSNGRSESRPVIRTVASLDGESWPIEVTLTSRDEMGFRMLLGRAALRRRFVVDPGRSFVVGGRPTRKKVTQKKATKKKATKKKATKKKAGKKKAAKRESTKKMVKKKSARKKVVKKRVVKKVATKKSSRKKVTGKRVTKRKAAGKSVSSGRAS